MVLVIEGIGDQEIGVDELFGGWTLDLRIVCRDGKLTQIPNLVSFIILVLYFRKSINTRWWGSRRSKGFRSYR